MEGLNLSKRLMCVADWIKDTGSRTVADVGTDHGYLPVYLAANGIADKVIAMDVRKKPLEKAGANIRLYGVDDRVEVRLSDGLDKMEPSETQAVTMCGMGGRLIERLLKTGCGKLTKDTQIIVSPQSEIPEFRRFLASSGFDIKREYFLHEDNQYYAVMDCRYDPDYELYVRFGKDNLTSRNADLHAYLLRELEINLKLLDTVNDAGATDRAAQLEREIYYIRRGLDIYYDGEVITTGKG